MTWQCNPRVAQSLIRYVRGGKTIFAGHSASAMCMAKSMEMTHEISEGWLEAFAVSAKKLMAVGGGIGGKGVMFDEKDLNGVGVAANVLGALPMFESPFSMRPHFKEAWMDDVFAANKKAELECEAEMGYVTPYPLTPSPTEPETACAACAALCPHRTHSLSSHGLRLGL